MCPMGSDFVFVFLFIMCGRGFPFLLDLSESSRSLLFLVGPLGGTVASWLVRSTPDWVVQVWALAGVIVLCS